MQFEKKFHQYTTLLSNIYPFIMVVVVTGYLGISIDFISHAVALPFIAIYAASNNYTAP